MAVDSERSRAINREAYVVKDWQICKLGAPDLLATEECKKGKHADKTDQVRSH